jgi:hypothetical protein
MSSRAGRDLGGRVEGEEQCGLMRTVWSTRYFWARGLLIWINLYSFSLNMSSDHGIPWEESQFIMSTYLLFELGVRSNRIVWYGALSITTTEFVGKFGINFFLSTAIFHNFRNSSGCNSPQRYYWRCKLTMHFPRNQFSPCMNHDHYFSFWHREV